MLRKAREDKGLTQERLAELAGVDQATISLLENGRIQSPGWDVVARVCAALELDPHVAFPVKPAPRSEAVA